MYLKLLNMNKFSNQDAWVFICNSTGLNTNNTDLAYNNRKNP